LFLPLTADESSRLIRCNIDQVLVEKGNSGNISMIRQQERELASRKKTLTPKFVCKHAVSMAGTGRRLGVTTNAVGYMVRTRWTVARQSRKLCFSIVKLLPRTTQEFEE